MLGANGDFASLNLYAYCGNNPISREDGEGNFWNLAAGALIGGLISAVTQITTNILTGENWSSGVIVATVSGAVSGAASASALGRAAQTVINAGIGMVGEAINQISSGTLFTEEGLESVAKSTLAGAVSGFIGGNGMRHKSSNYYKAAQSAKQTAEKVFGKMYGTTKTPTKLLNQAIKMVKKVGFVETKKTAQKFVAGCISSQIITRYEQ